MLNAWKVQWKNEEGKKFVKRFDTDKPTEAVTFGKDLKHRGLSHVDLISGRKAYPPPRGSEPNRPGDVWCPYCVKWREFVESAVKMDGFTTPVLLRCPICTISIKDCYVRIYNPIIAMKYAITEETRRTAQIAKKAKITKTAAATPRGVVRRTTSRRRR